MQKTAPGWAGTVASQLWQLKLNPSKSSHGWSMLKVRLWASRRVELGALTCFGNRQNSGQDEFGCLGLRAALVQLAGAREEAELQQESGKHRQHESSAGPWPCAPDATPRGFNHEDHNRQSQREQEAVPDKNARALRGCANDALDMRVQRQTERAEDGEEDDELDEGEEKILHGRPLHAFARKRIIAGGCGRAAVLLGF